MLVFWVQTFSADFFKLSVSGGLRIFRAFASLFYSLTKLEYSTMHTVNKFNEDSAGGAVLNWVMQMGMYVKVLQLVKTQIEEWKTCKFHLDCKTNVAFWESIMSSGAIHILECVSISTPVGTPLKKIRDYLGIFPNMGGGGSSQFPKPKTKKSALRSP